MKRGIKPPMKPKILITIFIFLGICLFTVVTGIFFFSEINPKKLPIYGQLQNFQLMDSTEKEFTLQNMSGKIWVADFVFTTCGSICPLMTKNMAALYRSYKLEPRVEFVSISVNPENDSPQVLAEYAKKNGADVNRWHFLTGSREAITQLAVEGFKIGSTEEPVFHSAKFILVDPQGRIRGYYEGTAQKEVRKLFKELAQLMKERAS